MTLYAIFHIPSGNYVCGLGETGAEIAFDDLRESLFYRFEFLEMMAHIKAHSVFDENDFEVSIFRQEKSI